MTKQQAVYIIAAKRSPIGAFNGELRSLHPADLGAAATAALFKGQVSLPTDSVEVFYGCVLSAGLGQAPARQMALKAGLPDSIPCTTLNKMCGSGMQAFMSGTDAIMAGRCRWAVVGGMESMSGAPHLLPKARSGVGYGHAVMLDHLMHDGLTDAYSDESMGVIAERSAAEEQVDRSMMDEWALCSLERSVEAQSQGRFDCEIVPIESGGKLFTEDELPRRARPEKIPLLRPAFMESGAITAANASAISDGAASLLLVSEELLHKLGLNPLAKVIASTSYAGPPADFPSAPVKAIDGVLKAAQWSAASVDTFEINEAFASVALTAINQLGLDKHRVNPSGGACTLGHPIGASGARILVTLVHGLIQRGEQRGVAAICIAGGEATAVAIERCD